jgi:hypothetical protein
MKNIASSEAFQRVQNLTVSGNVVHKFVTNQINIFASIFSRKNGYVDENDRIPD